MDEMTTLPNYTNPTNEEKLLLEIKGKNVTIDNLATKIKELENQVIITNLNYETMILENKRLKECLRRINNLTTGGKID